MRCQYTKWWTRTTENTEIIISNLRKWWQISFRSARQQNQLRVQYKLMPNEHKIAMSSKWIFTTHIGHRSRSRNASATRISRENVSSFRENCENINFWDLNCEFSILVVGRRQKWMKREKSFNKITTRHKPHSAEVEWQLKTGKREKKLVELMLWMCQKCRPLQVCP